MRAWCESRRSENLRDSAIGIEFRLQSPPVELEGHPVVIEPFPFVLDASGDRGPPRRRARARSGGDRQDNRWGSVLEEGKPSVTSEMNRQAGAALVQIASLVGPAAVKRVPAVDSERLG